MIFSDLQAILCFHYRDGEFIQSQGCKTNVPAKTPRKKAIESPNTVDVKTIDEDMETQTQKFEPREMPERRIRIPVKICGPQMELFYSANISLDLEQSLEYIKASVQIVLDHFAVTKSQELLLIQKDGSVCSFDCINVNMLKILDSIVSKEK
jgi:hypothetical protein